jgi:hypothetical protein
VKASRSRRSSAEMSYTWSAMSSTIESSVLELAGGKVSKCVEPWKERERERERERVQITKELRQLELL